MAGFFYIRVLICFAAVSALMAAVLGLAVPLVRGPERMRAEEAALCACANSLEQIRAGLDPDPGMSIDRSAGPVPGFVSVTAVRQNTALNTGFLVRHEDKGHERD